MKAAAFDELIKEVGNSILGPVGFKYSYGHFNYESTDYCLVFATGAVKGVDLYGRLASLSMRHPGFELEGFKNKGKSRFYSNGFPSNISPSYLEKWAAGEAQYSMRDCFKKGVIYEP